jgi:hypothetical protein
MRLLLALLAAVLLFPAAAGAATSFTDTYRYYDTWAWVSEPKCVGTGQYSAITGQEPDSGTHPVFVWLHGTYAPTAGTEALKFVSSMAARGFVAAAVHYDDFTYSSATTADKKARCIFDPKMPSSAIAKLCARPRADCSKGIVVAGHSQGGVLGIRAANWDPRVRAGYFLGFNEESTVESGARLKAASAPPDGTRALPNSRIRIIDGVADAPPDRRDELNTQTGKSCPLTATDCLDASGAGWRVVQNIEVQDGTADHCYHHGGGGCQSNPTFDPGWLNGTAPWELNPSLDWLASFADAPAPVTAPLAARTVPAGFVHQLGTRLLDGAGDPIKLRGVNLGGWLMWEGWIWGSGFDYVGETPMRNNLDTLAGPAVAKRFRLNIRRHFVTGSDFKAIAADGFNVARVPFNHTLLEDDARPFRYKHSGWVILDRLLASAKHHGVYLVLDMHAAPCSQTFSFTSDHVGSGLLWWSRECQDRTVALWKAIAARYAHRNVVAGYDLLNESVTGDATLRDFYKRLTAAIREVDPNHTLIYEGNDTARTFGLLTAPLDGNEALSFHDYPWMVSDPLSTRMPGFDSAADRLRSPLWAGEFGQSSVADIDRYVTTFNADPRIAGWALWTWKQSPGYPALQTIQHTDASRALINWIDNPSRPKPTPEEVTRGMTDFIHAIRFRNTVANARLRSVLTAEAG